MRLLCITDLHGSASALERILGAEPGHDAVVLGGDLTHFGGPSEAAALLDIAASTDKPVLAIAGNCDNAAIEALLRERDVSLHARGRQVDDAAFFGVSGMPPWMGGMYEFTEKELAGFLESGFREVKGRSPLVLVSHAPPMGTVDRTSSGRHVGSQSVRDWVARARPTLVVCGHIHEARGTARLGSTMVVNCGKGQLGHYALIDLVPKVKVRLECLSVQ